MKEIVFITGISGSGGSYLADYLLAHHPDVEVHGCTRWHSTTTHDNLLRTRDQLHIHECDLNDLPSLIRIFRAIKPTKIFNLASHANVRVAFDTPVAVINNNVALMTNILEAMRLECPEAILQQCSTSEIYGNPEVFPMVEDHAMKPVNPYSVSKLTQEALCYAYFKSWKLRVVITRAFAYINPRRRELFSTAFAQQVADIEAGKKDILHHGNLDSIRTLIDVRDVMEAYWLASEHCEYGTPYNIGGENIISVGEFLTLLVKNAKTYIHCEQDPALMRPVDVTKQIPNVEKFHATTGWTPKYSLEESIQWLLEYCRGKS